MNHFTSSYSSTAPEIDCCLLSEGQVNMGGSSICQEGGELGPGAEPLVGGQGRSWNIGSIFTEKRDKALMTLMKRFKLGLKCIQYIFCKTVSRIACLSASRIRNHPLHLVSGLSGAAGAATSSTVPGSATASTRFELDWTSYHCILMHCIHNVNTFAPKISLCWWLFCLILHVRVKWGINLTK